MSIDPSNLHLKKELTAIRKAARVLRDPGTTSSWKSPLTSSAATARSNAVITVPSISSNWNHYDFHSQSQSQSQPQSRMVNSNVKEKKVFLYNWRSNSNQRSTTSEKSGAKSDEFQKNGGVLGGCLSPDDSLSDARNGGNGAAAAADSKSDSYFRTNTQYRGPPVSARRVSEASGKKKLKKVSNGVSKQKQQKIGFGGGAGNKSSTFNAKRALESILQVGSGLSGEDSVSLVDQSDDTEDYCKSEDLRQFSTGSPLLSRLRHGNWSYSSSKLLRASRKEDSCYSYSTPALSTGSLNRYWNRNSSTVGSWDGTTTSFNDGDDEIEDQLDFSERQGCGIPCYWSKRSTPKHRGVCRSCYSPSLSDTLRRKGSSMLCGSQTMYRSSVRRRRSTSGSKNRRLSSRTAQGILPLLTGSSMGTGHSDDELSTNYGELDLEALSRLDGRRWSSCRSPEGLELVAINGEVEEEGTPETIRSLSHKYRPMFFDDLIGQNIVVQSLINAISRRRIAPVYLFQGPRGTGKSSAARIFGAALNCMASEGSKPCGCCRECTEFISGKNVDLVEIDGSNKKGIDRVKYILKYLMGTPMAVQRYKILVIDECHLLPDKTWLAFLKFLEEPPPRLVFIFITTDLDNVPRTILSRCQKYLFNKIKDGDIVTRLRKISVDESLDVESEALDLIALSADGSLRDAETMLDQLSLLGKKITASLVNELVGVVSDDKLVELLELAMSSDTSETVKRARELMDSGVDPMVLMSQLASLIMDIIAGNYYIVDSKHSDSIFGGRNLTDPEMDRLKHALKLLSEAEKQLRVSSERSTWFTATLLQLGTVASPDPTQSGSSRRQSSKTTEEDLSSASASRDKLKPASASLLKPANANSTHQEDSRATHNQRVNGGQGVMVDNAIYTCINPEKLDTIWVRCIERCQSKKVKQLLNSHAKLVSISKVEGVLVAYIAFGDGDIKSRAERFLSSIRNSIEIVLRCNVEVKMILLPDAETYLNGRNSINRERKTVRSNIINGNSPENPVARGSFSDSESKQNEALGSRKARKEGVPMQRIEAIIREQRLETAWLQATEKGTPGSISRLKPEKNQVLPQVETVDTIGVSSQHWEAEINNEIKILDAHDGRAHPKDQIGKRVDHYPMSPSLLHDSGFSAKYNNENLGYESASGTGGCYGLLCWNNTKPLKKGKVKKGTPVGQHKGRQFSWLGECVKSKKTTTAKKESRFKK